MVGSAKRKSKGTNNVHELQFNPQRRHRSRRCFHHGTPVRLGRHFPADRLNLFNKDITMNERFLINRRDAKVMGVAAGLAD